MKITMIAVSSINGKITKGNESHIYFWTSKEDSKLFFSLIEKNNLIVMGSKTYESVRRIIKHKKDKLRVVLTKNPEKYSKETIRGILEFSDESPLKLITRLESRGYRKMLVVGGSTINTLFLKSKLVSDLYLTLEPKIFGQGQGLVSEENLEIKLKLISVRKLNPQGTLLSKYKVLSSD